jgi:hypothetical protein
MKIPLRQKGLALIVLVFILALTAIGYVVHSTDSTGIQNVRNKKTAAALAEAKTALLSEIIATTDAIHPIYFPIPDAATGFGIEGHSSGTLGIRDVSILGKLPWYSLGLAPLKDGWNECLWYVVSGRYKSDPEPTVSNDFPFNWDRQGQIDVIDDRGNMIARNLVALIIAPGPVLNDQNRSLANPNYKHCGGNYNARNYLDTVDEENAVEGEVNYFSGSLNGRAAPNTLNKTFVLASNGNYNDQFIFITVDDVFDSLVKRSDFVDKLNMALNDGAAVFSGTSASGSKGTDNIDCGGDDFCENWEEMLLLVRFPSLTEVVIDGYPNNCNGVLTFGGKRTGMQIRITEEDKGDPANYLEEPNLGAFRGETGKVFNGNSVFDGNNPSADVLKCL